MAFNFCRCDMPSSTFLEPFLLKPTLCPDQEDVAVAICAGSVESQCYVFLSGDCWEGAELQSEWDAEIYAGEGVCAERPGGVSCQRAKLLKFNFYRSDGPCAIKDVAYFRCLKCHLLPFVFLPCTRGLTRAVAAGIPTAFVPLEMS